MKKNVYKAPRLKNFYREFGTPTITEMKTRAISDDERRKISNDPKDIWYGSTNNQKFYIVYFSYDRSKERFEDGYAAKVYIWENTGKAFAIGLGNMMMLPVRDGKVPNHDKQADAVTYYSITYSKDVPNVASLPKTAKFGDIIKLELKTATTAAYDGWTTEHGYNFDPDYDLIEGDIISTTSSSGHNSVTKTYLIMVTGNTKINVTSYKEEYEE